MNFFRKISEDHNKQDSFEAPTKNSTGDLKQRVSEVNSMTSDSELYELAEVYENMAKFTREKADKVAASMKLRDKSTYVNF